jgi:hypothetical protein
MKEVDLSVMKNDIKEHFMAGWDKGFKRGVQVTLIIVSIIVVIITAIVLSLKSNGII